MEGVQQGPSFSISMLSSPNAWELPLVAAALLLAVVGRPLKPERPLVALAELSPIACTAADNRYLPIVDLFELGDCNGTLFAAFIKILQRNFLEASFNAREQSRQNIS